MYQYSKYCVNDTIEFIFLQIERDIFLIVDEHNISGTCFFGKEEKATTTVP